jgi:hypothetical protein
MAHHENVAAEVYSLIQIKKAPMSALCPHIAKFYHFAEVKKL